MAENLQTNIKITGDSTDAERAIVSTINELDKLASDLKKPLGKIETLEGVRNELGRMDDALQASRVRLNDLQQHAANAGSGGAKLFATELRAANTEVRVAESAYQRAAAHADKLGNELRAAGVDTSRLGDEKTRLAIAMAKAEKGTIDLKGRLLEERAAARDAAEKTREAGDAAQKAGEQSEKGAGGVGNLATGLKALAGAAVVREFLQANASMEAMTKALESVTGSGEAATKEMAFVRAEATRLGLEVGSAANSYTQLAASAKGTTLEGQATREIWSAVAESMARLGKTTAETDGALLAISQMMSKGVVSAEELRGQLGERMPGAFSAAARAMNTTTQGLGEMLQKGEIVASDFLPKFAAELRRTGGGGGEIDTFNANLARMKNAFTEAFTTIGDSGVMTAVSTVMKGAAFGVTLLVKEFELLGKTLGNVAYTAATLDFSGFGERQRELVAKTKEEVRAAEKAILGMGKAGAVAGEQIATGQTQVVQPAIGKTSEKARSLDEELKSLGIDPSRFEAGADAVAATFGRIAGNGKATGDQILTALVASLDKVSQEAAPGLEFALQEAFQAGRLSAAELEAGVDAVQTKAKGLWDEMDRGADAAKKLEEAYKTLGVISQAALDETARKAREAYETIQTSGAGVNVLSQAWQKYAETAIKANGGVADATIKSEAAARGYEIVIDKAGKTTLRAMSEAADATRGAGEAAQKAAGGYTAIADEATRAWEASEKALLAARETEAAQRESRRTAGGSQTLEQIFGPGFNLLSSDQQDAFIYRYQSEQLPKITAIAQSGRSFNTHASEGILRDTRAQIDALAKSRAAEIDSGIAPPQSTTSRVIIQLPSGRSGEVNVASQKDAQALTDLLKQLQFDMGRT